MIIIGIDPGTTRIGYGLIKKTGSLSVLDYGILKVKSSDNLNRVNEAVSHFNNLLEKFNPDIVAIEKLFFMNNQKTGLKVAELRGAIMFAASLKKLRICEYAPTEVKMAVTGYGKADKKAVSKMICLSLNIKTPALDDTSDALAIALTAAYDVNNVRG